MSNNTFTDSIRFTIAGDCRMSSPMISMRTQEGAPPCSAVRSEQ